MPKTTPILHVFELETHDSYGFPYPASQVPHTQISVLFVPNNNGTYMMKLKNFNFMTYQLLSENNYDESLQGMPPGGFLTTYANPLPVHFRPTEEQTWSFSANDPYLANFSYSNPMPPNIVFQATTNQANNTLTVTDLTAINSVYVGQPVNDIVDYTIIAPGTAVASVDYATGVITLSPPGAIQQDGVTATFVVGAFPTVVANFNVTINPYGQLSIFSNSNIFGIIPPGSHTILGKTLVYYPDNNNVCLLKPPENFVIESDFIDISKFTKPSLGTGIKDTHIHDIFEDVIAFSWSGNSNFVLEGQQANNILNFYVCIGKVSCGGKIKLGPVQNITNFFPATESITLSGDTTAGSIYITNVTNITEFQIGMSITDNNTSNPAIEPGSLITAIDTQANTITIWPFALLTESNVSFTAAPLYSQLVFDTSIAINRQNKDVLMIAFSTASALPQFAVSTQRGAPGTWSVPAPIDPVHFLFPFSVAGDCRGVKSDKFGNFIYSCTTFNYLVDTSEVTFYMTSNNGNSWTNIFESTESTSSIPTGIGAFDFPQIYIGNSGDPANPYGLFFAAEFSSFIAPLVDCIPYFGFIPIVGLGEVGSATFFQPLTGVSNNVEHVTITGKEDGTVYLCYQKYADNEFASNGGGSGIGPHLLFTKPPGPFGQAIQNLTGPYTTYQHVNNYFKATNSWNLAGFPYFTLSVQGNWYDNRRKALYFVITNPPSWYDGCTGQVSQDFELFLIVSLDNGVTWSRKFPIASTSKNNRGFVSIMMDEKSRNLYGGFYDARKSPDSTQLQFFGFRVSAKKLDSWVEMAKEESMKTQEEKSLVVLDHSCC